MLNSIFKKKDAVYELNEKDILPFDVSDLKIKSNQNITSPVINRVFNNLVENDLYNEQLVKNIVNSTNIPGATVTGSKNMVLESLDGQKFILTSNVEPNVIIGKRKVGNIESSLSVVNDLSGTFINFITSDGVNYIAGTHEGLYTSQNRLSGWRRVDENDYFQKSFIGENCTCILANTSSSEKLSKYLYFLGTNNGLYGLYSDADNFYWFRIQNNNLSGINSLKINEFDNKLYIATTSGLYWTDGLHIKLCNKTDNIAVNDICILSSENLVNTNSEILIATETGIKQSSFGYYINNIKILDERPKGQNNKFTYVDISSYQDGNLFAENLELNVSSFISADFENDLEYYYLSSTSTNLNLTFQTEQPVIEILKLSEDEYIFNDTFNLSVYNKATDNWKILDFSKIAENNNNFKYFYPIWKLGKIDNSNRISCYVYNYQVEFSGYSKEQEFATPFGKYEIFQKELYRINAKKIYNIDNDTKNFIIGGANGAYIIKDLRLCIPYIDENKNILSGPTNAITFTNTGITDGYKTKYLISSGNKIYNTFNTIQLNTELVNLPDGYEITNIFVEGNNKYNICTKQGLFVTDQVYVIDDELRKFTVSGVIELGNDLLSSFINGHIEQKHRYDTSTIDTENEEKIENENDKIESEFITALNNKAPAKLEKVPDEITTVSPVKLFNSIEIIKNDFVETIEFNDNNSYIKASVNNWAVNQLTDASSIFSESGYYDRFTIAKKFFDLSKIPYIFKKWKSGLKEFLIYIPSTATFYMNNPLGFSNSIYSQDSVPRKNISDSFSNKNFIPETATKLRVLLNNYHFNITNISNIQINGNSLPLQIYKDSVYCQPDRENLFDTVIQPSLVKTLPTIKTENVNNIKDLINTNGEIVLEFLCYGTDAQSIRILGE
jgi:hypothetical protein